MQNYRKVICFLVILMLSLHPVIAESATGNISGRIVSSSTSSTQSGSSGGGGGGGGGGAPLFNSTFSNAFVTSKYIYEVGEEVPLKLSEIYVNATDIVNVSILVDNPLYIDFRFANVIRLPFEMPKNAYRVYEFVFTKFGTRTKVEPKNASIIFRVSNDWIKEPEKLKLFEYRNDSWIEHPTLLLAVKDGFTLYKSSFNRSGFYYVGYPELKLNVSQQKEVNVTKSSNTSERLNESLNESFNETSSLEKESAANESANTTPFSTALQESLVGDIINDIIEFLRNLFDSIRSFFLSLTS